MDTLFKIAFDVALLIIVLWILYAGVVYAAGKLNLQSVNTALTSTTGKTVANAIDMSQFVAAYGSLTVIRMMPNVQKSPEGLAACDTLRNLITSWENAASTTTTTSTPKV